MKIICIGLNYYDHAEETGAAIPSQPVVFCKAESALLPHEGNIRLPKQSTKVEYEAELVVVIGKTAKNVSEADALQYVAGYACGNDVTARDWQKGTPAGQWFLGKSFDTFAPLSNVIIGKEEIPDPGCLDIELRLNGVVMQKSNTNNLIFSVPKLIEYVSQIMTLQPGDLIYTGTPGGIGDARTPPVYLKPGDTVEVEIEKIGVLRNFVQEIE
ncbi:MAG: fumarylacetoacetate hydrolase family protein [Planctomycetaceae bacterium]|jgi:2-keto-4-pentenoate hydratase/2-oxohepta-3-ene-1,7-dioic acid hydratase in catechol pathway|nr:fumarylacetoacetate hydrolase family protein [Planctomycetaceae bacterium]